MHVNWATEDDERPAWFDRAVATDDAAFDAAFAVFQSFFFGGDFSGSIGLYQPKLPLLRINPHIRFALSRDVNQSAAELFHHYIDVVEKCKIGTVKVPRFAVSAIVFDGKKLISCLGFARPAFAGLSRVGDGQLLFDIDQGYGVEVYAFEDRIYLRDYNPDENIELNMISFPKAPFQAQVREAAVRLEEIIEVMPAALDKSNWNW